MQFADSILGEILTCSYVLFNAHKVLCGIAPRYLGPLNRVTDISGRRSLRSSGTNLLVVPPFRLSTDYMTLCGIRRLRKCDDMSYILLFTGSGRYVV